MRAAAFSESDLDDAADAASDEIQAGSYDGGYVIEPDIEGQQLIVTANSTFSLGQQSAVEGVVAARPSPVDDIPVEFEEAEPVLELDHNSRSHYPPLDAGLNNYYFQAATDVHHGDCTSGYVVKRGQNQYGTTAGHCAVDADSDWWGYEMRIGGTRIGIIKKNHFASHRGNGQKVTADALLYSVPDGKAKKQITVKTSPYVFHRYVRAMVPEKHTSKGMTVCYSGAQTGARCGRVRHRYRDVKVGTSVGTINYRRLICGRGGLLDAAPGDSGAPVYDKMDDGGARAAGLLVGGLRIGPKYEVCFSPMNAVQEALNVELSKSNR